MYKVMIIEDDVQLSSLIKENLKKYGYEVYEPDQLLHIEKEFFKIKPHLVLLDINLPYYDGYYLCRTFRKQSNVPIIIISARNEEADQIMGLELGADDYITKPFTFELLQTKVKSCLRRVYGEYANHQTQILTVGEFTLDENTYTLQYQEQTIDLTKNECKLLKKFMEHPNCYIRREDLIEEVWDSYHFIEDNTLTVNITRLKQIFNKLGFDDVIKSKRGVGYMFNTSLGMKK